MARKSKKYLTIVFGKNKNKNKDKQTSFNPTISLSPDRKDCPEVAIHENKVTIYHFMHIYIYNPPPPAVT
jgi:hypothetical protein